MITEIQDNSIIAPISRGDITLLLRGKTFRGEGKDGYNKQIEAIHSIQKYIVTPLHNRFPDCEIHIKLCTYPHPQNIDLVNILGPNTELIELPENTSGQIYSYRQALKCINTLNEFVLILRPDLIFQKEVDFSRADKDKVLFQWNLFTRYDIKQVPDQYQFIGGNVFDTFKQLALTEELDAFNKKGTLHGLYNFLKAHKWEDKNIGFLNYIKNPNPNNPNCAIKGDPSNQSGNPMYKYTVDNKLKRRKHHP